MSDEPRRPPITDPLPPPNPIMLPWDDDAAGGLEPPDSLGAFSYIGRALSPREFSAYLAGYDFGPIAPDYLVLHHTAIPTLAQWTAGEAGLSLAQIMGKRRTTGSWTLDGMRDQYIGKGWISGPHLFIDERWIWLFSEMRDFGVHAAWGNSHRVGGHIHYSIGIEVLGDYTQQTWPPAIARMVGFAVGALRARLQTFEITYLYPAGSPGRRQIGVDKDGRPLWDCLHPDKLAWGGISSHRDYNKPECPGTAITEDYYLGILRQGDARVQAALATAVAPLTPNSPLLGPASGLAEQLVAYVQAQLPPTSEYVPDVGTIIDLYWQYAPTVGLDPYVAAVQCIFETDALRSTWAARPHRNPAGLGVHAEGGLSFGSWDEAVQAHLGQLLALAQPDNALTPAAQAMTLRNPRNSALPAALRGTVQTIADLSTRWAPAADYAAGLLERAAAIQSWDRSSR